MKLIQMTDIHLTTPGETIAGRDPITNFDRALTHAVENHPDAEAIIITGDLSDLGQTRDYEYLKERLAKIPIPVHLCIGNHDNRDVFLATYPELADENGFVQKTVSLSGGTAVLLDTWGPESHAGHFCETRADWLDAQLAGIEGPLWMFLHHHPVPTHFEPMDTIMLLDADRLGEVVARHAAKIRHMFFGHCHVPISGSFHGVPLSAPRGTSHAGWMNFGKASRLCTSDLPQAYALIIAEDPSVTVHMVEFGYEGEIRVGQ